MTEKGMGFDFWVHVVEVVVVVILIPSLRQLITTLVTLDRNSALMAQKLEAHTEDFSRHVDEDRENFKDMKDLIERRTWTRRDVDRSS